MGVKRPLDSGELDAIGRRVRVSGRVVEARATAPAPESAIETDEQPVSDVAADVSRPSDDDPHARRPYASVSTRTPWGAADGKYVYGPGVTFYSCPGHGGFKVSDGQMGRMHPALAKVGKAGWFEEDCEWGAVAVAFPHLFSAKEVDQAIASLKDYYPDEYGEATGATVPTAESYTLRRRQFANDHADLPVAVSAAGARLGHFGQRDEAANQRWSDAFDSVVGKARGVARVDALFVECRNRALNASLAADKTAAMSAIGDNVTEQQERFMFGHYLKSYGQVSADGQHVNFEVRPHGDLPVVRNVPAGKVLVTCQQGGRDRGGATSHWLVAADRYKARGASGFGYVPDPAVDERVAAAGG